MKVPDGFVQFAMPLTNGTTQFFRETAGAYTLKEAYLTPCALASVDKDGNIINKTGADYAAGKPVTGYIYDDGNAKSINFSGILSSIGAATDYAFEFVNNIGTATTNDDVTYTLSGNKTMAAKAAIKFPLISSSAWKVKKPGFVTVGGVKWAKWNVGATTEEGYCDYFAWGAIYPQFEYLTSNYQEGSISGDLDATHDVAFQKMGSEWHIPTKNDLEILKARISSTTWKNNYNGTGVNGHLITADNGTDTLFLPAADYWGGALYMAGGYGDFWSSTYVNTQDTWTLSFADRDPVVNCSYRDGGLSVRPVRN